MAMVYYSQDSTKIKVTDFQVSNVRRLGSSFVASRLNTKFLAREAVVMNLQQT